MSLRLLSIELSFASWQPKTIMCNTQATCSVVFFKKNSYLHVDNSLQSLRLGGLWCSLVPTVQLLLGQIKGGGPTR